MDLSQAVVALCAILNLVKLGHQQEEDSIDFAISKTSDVSNQDCYPQTDENQDQYLIGYGSLMQEASKNRTSPNTGENIPVRIKGYKRLWNCHGSAISKSTTYLGSQVAKENSTGFVATIFKLEESGSMSNYDAREEFYCRKEVPRHQISVMAKDKRPFPEGQYWIYVTRQTYSKAPSQQYPIVQSYVDIFISGCLELEEKFNIAQFAQNCILTTTGWDSPWVNDRIYPRRPFMYQPMASKIDRVLKNTIPKAYKNIRIE